jgi:hypothetical protein
MVAAGWQIQDQYQGFRGQLSAADLAGKYVYENLTEDEKRTVHILAGSRFDATNVAIWVDEPQLNYELGNPGAVYSAELAPKEASWIVAVGEITVEGNIVETISGEGFRLYKLR